MQRVLVLGCPGAGKSTASKRLANALDLPLIHLDRHYWRPGWEPTPPDLWRSKVAELIAGPRWIIDGNYASTLDLRLLAANTVIHLDFSTGLCLRRVLRRTLVNLGRERDGELPAGCPERLDAVFFRYVLHYRRKFRDRDMMRLAGFAGTLHRFTSPRELEHFLQVQEQ